MNLVKGVKDTIGAKTFMGRAAISVRRFADRPGETVEDWYDLGKGDWSNEDGTVCTILPSLLCTWLAWHAYTGVEGGSKLSFALHLALHGHAVLKVAPCCHPPCPWLARHAMVECGACVGLLALSLPCMPMLKMAYVVIFLAPNLHGMQWFEGGAM